MRFASGGFPFLQVNPSKVDKGVFMSQSARFWDRIAVRYSKQPIASTAIAHAPYVKSIEVTDISSRMIEIARGKAELAKVDNISFQCASTDEIQVQEQSLDAVLALNLLHLLEDRDELLSSVSRMLKPGGVFVSSTPCLGDMSLPYRLIAPVGRYIGAFPLVKVFTIFELESSIGDAGFEIDYKWHQRKNKPIFIVAKKVV
jgi:SAM-dependent methyltransferase